MQAATGKIEKNPFPSMAKFREMEYIILPKDRQARGFPEHNGFQRRE